jgi:hypothetical protein
VPLNQPFLIGSVAATLADFQKLSSDHQAVAFLRRLAFLFPAGKTFHRGNLSLNAYGRPDSSGLCTGWPLEDLAAGVDYLLKSPWRTLERHGYIAEAVTGHSFFELTEEGWSIANSPNALIAPDRSVLGAIRFLHPDLQGYEHYFREGKLKEAVTAAFMRVENRLNQIRDASPALAAKGVSGVSLPYKLFDTGDLKFPYPRLAAGDPQSRAAFEKQLKGFLTSGIGWFRNSFDHEPHNLPTIDEGETLELLFVASHMLRTIDRSV